MPVKRVTLPDGEEVPALGMGTWMMGESPVKRAGELAALRTGLDLGLTLIDTAEMYGEGLAEELVAEAVAGRRDEVFIVSKVYPHNATRRGTADACERSLKRLGTDRIDLYLLHWRGGVPLGESLDALAALRKAGKIRHYGVSNLDLADMREAWSLGAGRAIATNQLLYNPTRRGIEWDLLPWMRERGMPLMAYSPIEQARLVGHPGLAGFSKRHGMTPAQAALAWALRDGSTIVIPKASHPSRVKENAGALEFALTPAQLAELDALFAPPRRATPLEML